ncbi:MAG: PilT/PilU family type 4a pilus ATPase [Myxococcales bacterium]|nr:PilT/PilU family type 4a pilus ATPase [Myxococcales bacterium]
MIAERAADLVLSTGRAPRVRKVGEYREVDGITIDERRILDALGEHLTPARRQRLDDEGSLDLAIELAGEGGRHRFRANIFRTMTGLAAAFRPVWDQVPDLDALRLPAAVAELIEFPYGLVLVAGPTGAGKSTTLCALVERINRTRRRHVITLEDPIEYLFRDRMSVIHQREIGVHVESFPAGLRAALREAPDVIFVGEMRDLDTIAAAITAAETGHLVLSTLHSGSAQQAIDRMVDVFPEHQQAQIRFQLAEVLRAVLVQRLLVTGDGRRRVPAIELVRVNYAIAAMIRERRTHQFTTTINSGRREGMLPFDVSLAELVRAGELDAETATRAARDPNYFRRALEGATG